MTSKNSFGSRAMRYRRGAWRLGLCVFALAVVAVSRAQNNAPTPATDNAASPDKVVGGYLIHQSIDIGGHIQEQSGSQRGPYAFVSSEVNRLDRQ